MDDFAERSFETIMFVVLKKISYHEAIKIFKIIIPHLMIWMNGNEEAGHEL